MRGALRRDLNLMVRDGAAYGIMVGAGESYLPLFALSVGFGDVAAGLLATIPMLGGSLLQLLSPWGVRRLGSNRRWVVLCVFVQAASFVPIVIGAMFGRIPLAALYLVVTAYWAAGLGAGPAWNVWAGTIVPQRLRSSFFARHARFAQLAVLLGLVGAGATLERFEHSPWLHWAFAGVFAVAAAARFTSSRILALQSEPRPVPIPDDGFCWREFLGRFRGGSPWSGRVLGYLVAAQVGLYVANPFITPYIRNGLRRGYGEFVVLLAAVFLAKVTAYSWCGRFARRFGPRRLLWIGGAAVVPLPALWMIADHFAYQVFVQIATGVAMAAYELATTLLFFETLHERERAHVLSLYNAANGLAMAGGSLAGAWVLGLHGEDFGGYFTIFLLSVAVRAGALLLLRRLCGVPLQAPQRLGVAVRTHGVEAGAGSVDRPILATVPAGGDGV